MVPGRRARGQVLPFFAIMLGVLVLFATLVLDGSFMLETRHDLNVIALHAAQTGARRLDNARYNTDCGAYLAANPGGNVVDCQQFLVLDRAAATTAARNSANQWLAELNRQKLGLPGFAPTAGAVVDVAVSADAHQISVTIRYCYQPFLVGWFAGPNPPCPSAVLVATTVTSSPLTGH